MTAVLDALASRIAAVVTDRTVYPYAAPDGPKPPRYLVVRGSSIAESASRAVGQIDVSDESVWVASVSRNDDPQVAAREAQWGADAARAALRDWSPQLGGTSWLVRLVGSQPAYRDEQVVETAYVSVGQFSVRTTI